MNVEGARETSLLREGLCGKTGCGCCDDGEVEEVVIIGGGPGGVACAIQLERMGISPILIERNQIGGLLRYANLVGNYPGFPVGIPGMELTKRMAAQLDSSGVNHIGADVEHVEGCCGNFIVRTGSLDIRCRHLVVASGSRPRRVNFKIYGNPQITYDLFDIIDGNFQKILIIGGGDVAFDHAVRLTECGREVTILSRSEPVANRPLLDAVQKLGVRVVIRAKVMRIGTKGERTIVSHSEGEDVADAILVACGREPTLPRFGEGMVAIDEMGRNAGGVNGLYIIGDAAGGWRHAGIAVGDGLNCAMDIFNELRRERDEDAAYEEVN